MGDVSPVVVPAVVEWCADASAYSAGDLMYEVGSVVVAVSDVAAADVASVSGAAWVGGAAATDGALGSGGWFGSVFGAVVSVLVR